MIPTIRSREVQAEAVVLKVRKVLIVDEAPPVRRMLLETFHKLGLPSADVLVTGASDEALELFARSNPSIVFCELVGEDPQSGLDMVLEMLALDPHVKVVLVTAEPSESLLVRKAVRAGVFALVQKPLRHEKIRNVLTEIENEAGGIERYR